MSASRSGASGQAEALPATLLGDYDPALLIRVEDAGLNASAPPQQRWMDGWIVRTNPGKAQRARCINAVAPGRRPAAEKLAECAALYRSLRLPVIVRITPFTQPHELGDQLAAAGYAYHDDTRVMVLPRIDRRALDTGAPPGGTSWREATPDEYAEAIGALRGSPGPVRQAHAERLKASPVAYRGYLLRGPDGHVAACGQIAQEGDLVGLYDIATAPAERRQGHGEWLCKRLLAIAHDEAGARAAYLQVGADNPGARRLYARLGFADAYSYHYRLGPEAG